MLGSLKFGIKKAELGAARSGSERALGLHKSLVGAEVVKSKTTNFSPVC